MGEELFSRVVYGCSLSAPKPGEMIVTDGGALTGGGSCGLSGTV